MQGIELISKTFWLPLSPLGFTHSFFNVDAEIVIYTWITLACLGLLLLYIRYTLNYKKGFVRFLALQYVHSFKQLSEQTFECFHAPHFYFITALFTFILFSNSIAIIPWLEEPTKDLNTTLALSIISFIYIQVYAIYVHGFSAYIQEYFSPLFLMFPLNVVGKLATIISMSFRLFGNIYGGATIGSIFFNLIKSSLSLNSFALFSATKCASLFVFGTAINLIIVLFFGLFEGFIQAFVFSMLALTYLSTAIRKDSGEAS